MARRKKAAEVPEESSPPEHTPPSDEQADTTPSQAVTQSRRRRRTKSATPPAPEEQAGEKSETTAVRPTTSQPVVEPSVPVSPFSGGPVLVFEVAGQRYGLAVEHVVQIVEMLAITQLPTAPAIVVGVVNFRGQVIPIVDMRRRLRQPPQGYHLHTPIVVSRLNERTVGLVVDAVKGVIDVHTEQIELPGQIFTEDMILQVHHLTGVARLSDGLLLLLSADTFLTPEEETSLAQALSSQG